MQVKVKNKMVKIPDEQIKKNMEILDLTEEEAIQMYLEDEGYEVNEEDEKLTKQAKENKTDKIRGESEKPRAKRNVEPKINENKEFLIKLFENALKSAEIVPKVTNKSKIIEFSYNNKQFKLDLIEKRVKKSE